MTELAAEIGELLEVHKELKKTTENKCEVVLSGTLLFEAEPDGLAAITDSFEIEMLISDTYADELPRVSEKGGKIDSNYEHLFTDRTLCLGVPVEMRRIFAQQPSLLGFVNRLVVPYFYGYCHWKEYGEHPFGEQKHGGEGIIQYYTDMLNLDDEVTALTFICFLYEHGYRGHHDCPCGSGRKIRKCHGPTMRDLHSHHTPSTRYHDLNLALEFCHRKCSDEKLVFPDKLKKQINRILNGSERKCPESYRFR